MEIIFNGNKEILASKISVIELINSKRIHDKQGLIILINEEVLKKEDWSNRQIKTNDQVEVLKFVSGG